MSSWKAPSAEAGKKKEENPFRKYVATAIYSITDRNALPELQDWSRSADREVSIAAIATYARLTRATERYWMTELLKEGDDSVRQAVFEALGGVVLEDAKTILDAVSDDSGRSYYLSRGVQRFISAQTDRRSLGALREICRNGPSFLRYYAIETLAAFSEQDDLQFLIAVARNPDDADRGAAINALAQYRHQDAIDALREIMAEVDAPRN